MSQSGLTTENNKWLLGEIFKRRKKTNKQTQNKRQSIQYLKILITILDLAYLMILVAG